MNKTNNQKQNLFKLFQQLEDHRRSQGRRHDLEVILTIVVMSIMSGFYQLRAIGDFIKKNRKELLDIFEIDNDRLPSHQTVGRALQNIDFDELSDVFYQWAINYVEIGKKDWFNVDGKAISGTLTGGSQDSKQNFISLVSIFVNKRKQVLKIGKIENQKQSEIPMVKTLIKELGLEGAIITLDALHCTKDTTNTIIDSKNDYVIGVKSNRKKLYNQLKKTPNQTKQ